MHKILYRLLSSLVFAGIALGQFPPIYVGAQSGVSTVSCEVVGASWLTCSVTNPQTTPNIVITSTLTTPVTSVFGRTGVVVATSGDYSTTLVTEGTSLYYTDTRARAAISAISPIVFSGSTGQITCPLCAQVPSALTANNLVLGSSVSISSLGSLGTTSTLLHGNAAGPPSWGSVVNADITNGTIDLTTKVTGVLPNANTTADSANTASAIVTRNSSGNFSAGTITASLSGNATTATALAANPTDCSANQYANAIAASGNLTCAQVAYSQVSGTPTLYYQTLQTNTTPATQRSNLNFSSAFALSDSSGSDRSTIDIATRTGTTNTFATATGVFSTDDCIKINASGNLVSAGGACSGGGGGITALTGDVTASGTGSITATLANIPSAVPMAGYLAATAIAAPGTPSAGIGRIYVDSTSKNLSVKDDAGVVKHGVQTETGSSNNFLTAISDAGAVTKAQPSAANLSNGTTGSGAVVLATSPTLVTPLLGTPTSVTLTNGTGLPISTGVTGLAANMATFLGTSSSANLAATVTDETGSGALVFATSPTLVTPALGTPSALVGTNITGTASGLTAGTVTLNANLSGDVTSSGSNATTIASGVVTLAKQANFPANSIQGNNTGSSATPLALSISQVNALLGTVTGSSLTSGLPVIGNGTNTITVGTKSGNTTKFVTTTGSFSTDDCAKFDASGNIVSAGAACGTGGGGGITALTGDVTASGSGSVTATIAALAVTNAKIANSTIDLTTKVTGLLPNANIANPSMTVGGATCTLGSSCTPAATPTGSASGDLSGSYPGPSVVKVNAVSYPASPSTNTVPLVTSANTITYSTVPNMALSNSSLTVNTSSPLGGGGTVSLGSSLTLTCPTCSTSSGANPSASAGLAAVNGSASTFLRSDGAPAISQSISPTWSGTHTFSNTILGSVSGNAGTVTTNANLTGPITSSGNATAIAAQTGTGTTFVMSDSPTMTTIGIVSKTSSGALGGIFAIRNGASAATSNEATLQFWPASDFNTSFPGSQIRSIMTAGPSTYTTDLSFSTYNNGITSDVLRLSGVGNVTVTQNSVTSFTSVASGAVANTLYLNAGLAGFGTNNPVRQVDIVGNGINDASGTFSQLGIRGTGSNAKKLNIGYNTTSDFGFIEAVNQSSAWLNISLQPSGGNVGIGTTSPTAKLHTTGGVRFANFTTGVPTFDSTGLISSTANVATIPRYLRMIGTGIIGTTPAWTALPVLNSSDYDWTRTPSGTIAIGSQTKTLTPCPEGINSLSVTYGSSIRIIGSGTPETSIITAYSSGSGACDITFTAVGTQSAGYTLASSSFGQSEAINTLPSTGGTVNVNPTAPSTLYGTVFVPPYVSLRSNGVQILPGSPSLVMYRAQPAASTTIYQSPQQSFFSGFFLDGTAQGLSQTIIGIQLVRGTGGGVTDSTFRNIRVAVQLDRVFSMNLTNLSLVDNTTLFVGSTISTIANDFTFSSGVNLTNINHTVFNESGTPTMNMTDYVIRISRASLINLNGFTARNLMQVASGVEVDNQVEGVNISNLVLTQPVIGVLLTSSTVGSETKLGTSINILAAQIDTYKTAGIKVTGTVGGYGWTSVLIDGAQLAVDTSGASGGIVADGSVLRHLTISNSYFISLQYAPGVVVSPTAEHLHIQNNTFNTALTATYALVIGSGALNFSNISGNSFQNQTYDFFISNASTPTNVIIGDNNSIDDKIFSVASASGILAVNPKIMISGSTTLDKILTAVYTFPATFTGPIDLIADSGATWAIATGGTGGIPFAKSCSAVTAGKVIQVIYNPTTNLLYPIC